MELAQALTRGELTLDWLDDENIINSIASSQLYDIVHSIDGFGPFSARNICQLLGKYDVVPCDTETIRFMKMYAPAAMMSDGSDR